MTVDQHGPLPPTNFLAGRNGQKIDKIVLHTMVGWIAGADASFHNPDRRASAHFGVRVDGSLWQWVQVWDTAYHAGQWDVNTQSIGIEHEDGGAYNDPRPDALYDRSAALVAQFCAEYGIPCERGTGGPGVYDHRDVHTYFAGDATSCPDALDTDRIIRQAKAIIAPAPAPAPVAPVLADPVQPAADALHEWARLYAQEAPIAGVRPDVALAQAMHETGRFTYPGTAQPEWNNPAGLGVTGAPGVGNVFVSKRAGCRAHLQHLLMYFRPAHTEYCDPGLGTLYDQRHYAHRGYANDLAALVGTWAVPGIDPATGKTYADAVAALIPEAQALLG